MSQNLDLPVAPAIHTPRGGSLGLILNRNSHRSGSRLKKMRAFAASCKRLEYIETNDSLEIPAALERFAAAGIEVLATHGGDGTAQAVLTYLNRSNPFPTIPPLALLAGGNTNMVAGDVGSIRATPRALEGLVRSLGGEGPPLRIATRPLMRLEPTPGAAPIYGFFFGTAAVYRATLLTRRRVHRMGLTGSIGPTLTLGAMVVRLFTGRAKKDRILRPDRVEVSLDGGPPEAASYIVLLVTTLEKLIGGVKPFWGTGDQPLRFTGMTYPFRSAARVLPRALRGRPHPAISPENGYTSLNVHRVSLRLSCPFTIDGELIKPNPEIPVLLSAGGTASFVVP